MRFSSHPLPGNGSCGNLYPEISTMFPIDFPDWQYSSKAFKDNVDFLFRRETNRESGSRTLLAELCFLNLFRVSDPLPVTVSPMPPLPSWLVISLCASVFPIIMRRPLRAKLTSMLYGGSLGSLYAANADVERKFLNE
jgi:hypothetical protein